MMPVPSNAIRRPLFVIDMAQADFAGFFTAARDLNSGDFL
jgi:hypothetical protein